MASLAAGHTHHGSRSQLQAPLVQGRVFRAEYQQRFTWEGDDTCWPRAVTEVYGVREKAETWLRKAIQARSCSLVAALQRIIASTGASADCCGVCELDF